MSSPSNSPASVRSSRHKKTPSVTSTAGTSTGTPSSIKRSPTLLRNARVAPTAAVTTAIEFGSLDDDLVTRQSSSSTRHVAFAPTSPSPSTLPFPSSAPATTEEPLSSLKDSLRVRLDSDTRQRERRLSGETIAAPNKLRKKRPEEQKRERRASETSTEPSVHEEDEVVPEVAMVEEEQPTDEILSVDPLPTSKTEPPPGAAPEPLAEALIEEEPEPPSTPTKGSTPETAPEVMSTPPPAYEADPPPSPKTPSLFLSVLFFPISVPIRILTCIPYVEQAVPDAIRPPSVYTMAHAAVDASFGLVVGGFVHATGYLLRSAGGK